MNACGDVRVELWCLRAQKSVEPPEPSFADEFFVSHEYAIPQKYVRQSSVSLPLQVHCL